MRAFDVWNDLRKSTLPPGGILLTDPLALRLSTCCRAIAVGRF